MRKIMSEFLDIGEKSYYVWKNSSHIKLMAFLEKYLDEDNIREYIDTDEIRKFKLIKEFSDQEYLYNEKILEMLEVFNDYDNRDFNDYDYYRYDFDTTSYIFNFIEYLSPKNDNFEINLNTYNEYLMLKHEEAIFKVYNAKSSYHSALNTYEKEKKSSSADKDESMIHFYQSDPQDFEFYLKAANDEKKEIESILNVIHKTICTADRRILLQLEILKKHDFEPLIRHATKSQINAFLRTFISQWIFIKYDTDIMRTKKVIEDIPDFKKINLQELIATILE